MLLVSPVVISMQRDNGMRGGLSFQGASVRRMHQAGQKNSPWPSGLGTYAPERLIVGGLLLGASFVPILHQLLTGCQLVGPAIYKPLYGCVMRYR